MDTLGTRLARLAVVGEEMEKLEEEKRTLSRQIALEAAPEVLDAAGFKCCSVGDVRFRVATRRVFTADCKALIEAGFGRLTSVKTVFNPEAYGRMEPEQKQEVADFVEVHLCRPGITFSHKLSKAKGKDTDD
ncbi:MAG: hypothetical protein WCK89_21250 [bacterium]